jgi:mono/diheme cytochrome c family protein
VFIAKLTKVRKMNKATKSLISASAILLAFQAQTWAQKVDVAKAEYLSSCGPCHGSDAKGKGPLAGELKVTPADLTQLTKKNGGVFPMNAVYEKIDGRQEVMAHGPRDMPVWGYRYTPYPIAPDQAFDLKSPPSNLSSNLEPVIRGRILPLIDYLYRIQEK